LCSVCLFVVVELRAQHQKIDCLQTVSQQYYAVSHSEFLRLGLLHSFHTHAKFDKNAHYQVDLCAMCIDFFAINFTLDILVYTYICMYTCIGTVSSPPLLTHPSPPWQQPSAGCDADRPRNGGRLQKLL